MQSEKRGEKNLKKAKINFSPKLYSLNVYLMKGFDHFLWNVVKRNTTKSEGKNVRSAKCSGLDFSYFSRLQHRYFLKKKK